jgi:hypothetical protein
VDYAPTHPGGGGIGRTTAGLLLDSCTTRRSVEALNRTVPVVGLPPVTKHDAPRSRELKAPSSFASELIFPGHTGSSTKRPVRCSPAAARPGSSAAAHRRGPQRPSQVQVRQQERAHEAVLRRLGALGVGVPRAGQRPAEWLAQALEDASATAATTASPAPSAIGASEGGPHIALDAQPDPSASTTRCNPSSVTKEPVDNVGAEWPRAGPRGQPPRACPMQADVASGTARSHPPLHNRYPPETQLLPEPFTLNSSRSARDRGGQMRSHRLVVGVSALASVLLLGGVPTASATTAPYCAIP